MLDQVVLLEILVLKHVQVLFQYFIFQDKLLSDLNQYQENLEFSWCKVMIYIAFSFTLYFSDVFIKFKRDRNQTQEEDFSSTCGAHTLPLRRSPPGPVQSLDFPDFPKFPT